MLIRTNIVLPSIAFTIILKLTHTHAHMHAFTAIWVSVSYSRIL